MLYLLLFISMYFICAYSIMINVMKEWEDVIDDVKRMNVMMIYLRCVIIRDK